MTTIIGPAAAADEMLARIERLRALGHDQARHWPDIERDLQTGAGLLREQADTTEEQLVSHHDTAAFRCRFLAAWLMEAGSRNEQLPTAVSDTYMDTAAAMRATGPILLHLRANASRPARADIARRIAGAPDTAPDGAVTSALSVAERAYRHAAVLTEIPTLDADVSRLAAGDAHLLRIADELAAVSAGRLSQYETAHDRLQATEATLIDEMHAVARRAKYADRALFNPITRALRGDSGRLPRLRYADIGAIDRLAGICFDLMIECRDNRDDMIGAVCMTTLCEHFRGLALDLAALPKGTTLPGYVALPFLPNMATIDFRLTAHNMPDDDARISLARFLAASVVAADTVAGAADLTGDAATRDALLFTAQIVEQRGLDGAVFARWHGSLHGRPASE